MNKKRFCRKTLSVALASVLTNWVQAAEPDPATLPTVVIKEAPTTALKLQSPQTSEGVSFARIAETVNIVDTEDAVKYLPSIFIRKRNYGDTQPVMATRSWGVGSSARSLVYGDGVLLTALVANNNTIGAPRWGLIAPEEIERIDILYGPFSAAYPGNSMGAVMEIATRMPKTFEASVNTTAARQDFDLYGTSKTFSSRQFSATLGNRSGAFSWWLSGNQADSYAQPLTYVTTSTALPLAGTTGGYKEWTRIAGTPGATAASQVGNVLGATGLLHTNQDNLKFKAAFDLTSWLTASYTLGLWRNDGHADVQTYLNTAAGQPTYAGQAGFGTGYYDVVEKHSMHSLSLKSDTRGAWDWEAVITRYNFDTDLQRNPDVAATGAAFKTTGQVQRYDGTGWSTQDLKATWRPSGANGAHVLSFGVHHDLYKLVNVKYNVTNWINDDSSANRASEGNGKTEINALWLQDVWRLAPALKATLGGRWEHWKAFDGYNWSGTAAVNQRSLTSNNFSPKASLSWDTPSTWLVTASLGKAWRYPTVSELYQIATVAGQTVNPNPDLKPENVLAAELAFEKELAGGKLRVSLFQDDIRDALISQSSLLVVNGTPTTSTLVVNVEKVRSRGIELAFQKENVLINGLDLSGSLTYTDARIRADPLWSSTNPVGTTVVGKHAPNVPDWRATLVGTYRFSDKFSTTLAARYSGRQYSTMDNTDNNSNVYQGFHSFFVMDAKLRYQIDKHWAVSAGVDNLNNNKYFLFHPFPQRTYVANLKYNY